MQLCYLAQEITRPNKKEIHARAIEGHGNWNEQLNDYCPSSGLRMDDLISEILAVGFDREDLMHLEHLSDPLILQRLKGRQRYLRNNVKEDVIAYLTTWANVLENQLLEKITIPKIIDQSKVEA